MEAFFRKRKPAVERVPEKHVSPLPEVDWHGDGVFSERVQKAREAARQVENVLLGKETVVGEVLLAILAGGHSLLEDIPGVGKTTLALAFSRTFDLDFHRVQFTPDVMPADLTGFSLYRRDREAFVYQPGSVFCNLLLADELNRASPRTQSALLEVMEEGRVSVEGVTREVPKPFIVIATQNPFGSAGTQTLPESQTDRFLISLSLGYPDEASEIAMARSVGQERPVERLRPIAARETLLKWQAEIHTVYIKEEVYRYLVALVAATRSHAFLIRGGSPRATIALVRMARAAAWYQGRNFVTPNDILTQFPYVLSHRILFSQEALMNALTPMQILQEIARAQKKPRMEEPR